MAAFFVHMLESAFCLAVLFGCYRLLLSRETFHRFNRIALLSLLVLSCIAPLLEIPLAESAMGGRPFAVVENQSASSVAQGAEPVAAIPWREALLLVYPLGVVFFLLRLVWGYWRMWQVVRSCTLCRVEADGTRILTHRDDETAPFSWLHFIVLSEADLAANGQAILLHERAHIRARHSLDCMVADICTALQWFNPAAWLLVQELRNIHEYEADERVLASGVDARGYQLLLIRKAVGARLYSVANSLNHSPLQKRISMMRRKRSSPWACAKYLCVLPLVAASAAALAYADVSSLESELSACKVGDLFAFANAEVGKPSVRPDTVAVAVEKTVRASISRQGKGALDAPVIVLDGKMYDPEWVSLENLNLKSIDIASITVLKRADAVRWAYSERATEHGVIIIDTKNGRQAR